MPAGLALFETRRRQTATSRVRAATADDIPQMLLMAARFFAESGLPEWFKFDPQSCAVTAGKLIEEDAGTVLVAETNGDLIGMAAALAYPCWHDRSHRTAQEMFWWVEPEHRNGSASVRLWRQLEEWAGDQGCQTMEMGALEASRPEALAHLYGRRGYGPKERIFCRRLV